MSRSVRPSVFALFILLAVFVAGVVLWPSARRGGESAEAPAAPSGTQKSGESRPGAEEEDGAAAVPTELARPVKAAGAPSADWDAEAFQAWLHSPWPEYEGPEEPVAPELSDYEGDAPPELSDLLAKLSPRASFDRHLRDLADAQGADPVALGRRLLSFDDPTLRALGGALLSDADALDAETAAALVRDPDPFVPLLVGERVLDRRGPAAAAPFLEGLRARRLSEEALRAAAGSPEGMQGGGRLAMELLLEGRDEGGREALCLETARDASLPYDVRMDAVLRMAGSLPEAEALERLGTLLEEAGDPAESLWAEALLREIERLGRNAPIEEDLAPRPDEPDAPEEGVDVSEAPDGSLRLEELGWFLSDANATGPEDAALRIARWLADAPDAEAEPGCADAILAFVDEFPERQFDPVLEAEEPLARLRALAERVRARERAE